MGSGLILIGVAHENITKGDNATLSIDVYTGIGAVWRTKAEGFNDVTTKDQVVHWGRPSTSPIHGPDETI